MFFAFLQTNIFLFSEKKFIFARIKFFRIMTATALNGLLNYILTLNLSVRNSKWLASKILESTEKKKVKPLDPEIAAIPEEFRCDPYEVSPSGDPFFADKRNVEGIRQRLEEAQNSDISKLVSTKSREEIEQLIESL